MESAVKYLCYQTGIPVTLVVKDKIHTAPGNHYMAFILCFFLNLISLKNKETCIKIVTFHICLN